MINLPAGTRILLATRPVDFRKGAHGLAALAQEVLAEDAFSGTVIVYRSKRSDRLKILMWDMSGLVMVWKQMQQGSFRWPPIVDGVMRLWSVEFAALVDGLDWTRVQQTRSIRETLRRRIDSPSMDTEQAASPSLPDDIEALRAMVIALMTERDAVTAERDTLLERNERLHHLLLKLRRMQFGTKSERLPEEQLQLGLEAIEQAIAKNEAETEKRDPALRKDRVAKRRGRNAALPAGLPRIEVTLEPEAKSARAVRAR